MHLALVSGIPAREWRDGDHRDLDTALLTLRRQHEQQQAHRKG